MKISLSSCRVLKKRKNAQGLSLEWGVVLCDSRKPLATALYPTSSHTSDAMYTGSYKSGLQTCVGWFVGLLF